MAIYNCLKCEGLFRVPRAHHMKYGDEATCPKCEQTHWIAHDDEGRTILTVDVDKAEMEEVQFGNSINSEMEEAFDDINEWIGSFQFNDFKNNKKDMYKFGLFLLSSISRHFTLSKNEKTTDVKFFSAITYTCFTNFSQIYGLSQLERVSLFEEVFGDINNNSSFQKVSVLMGNAYQHYLTIDKNKGLEMAKKLLV